MVKKYKKLIKMGTSVAALSLLSFLFGFLGNNKSEYTTILPRAHADMPTVGGPSSVGGVSGDSGDSGGSGGAGDCSGGSDSDGSADAGL